MISIILPTYNSLQFLEERVESILSQTIKDWECIVIDGYSTDGTWEYLNEIIGNDTRFIMYQSMPKGVYNAWNLGVQKSRGDYIYFATSDDTMTKDCLEELLKGFHLAPDCGIAHCCLNIIDEKSNTLKDIDWKTFLPQRYFENNYHIRKAPLVGLLYATHKTVIHSFTQILIKRSVFDEQGLFLENMGPQSDLEWGMRVGFNTNIVHIPLTLATWRVHKGQETSFKLNLSEEKTKFRLIKMALDHKSNNTLSKKVKDRIVLFEAIKLLKKCL